MKAYPWIGVFQVSGNVVLFSSPSCGTCIANLEGGHTLIKIGACRSDWNEANFTALDGSVTLSN